jgi:hypothetical protein
MANTAAQIGTSEILILRGTVVAIKPRMIVRTDRSIVQAVRATSCLVEPEIGDLVMLAHDPEAQVFVLAVLQRDERIALVLRSERDIIVESKAGAVRLRGQEQVELSSEGSLEIAAPQTSLHTLRANLNAADSTFTGKSIFATVQSLKVVASSIESLAESVIERCASLIRQISGSEQVLARNLQYRAEELCSMHGKNSMLTAKQLVRIDSDQIHIG